MTGFVCIENPPLDKALTIHDSIMKEKDKKRNPPLKNEGQGS